MTKLVRRPGSRHGRYWIDKQGQIRYGRQPQATPPVARADPLAPPPPAQVPEDKRATPQWAEFGDWSPEATTLHLRGALFYGDAIARICRRFRQFSLRMGAEAAARRACRGLAGDEYLRLTRSVGRLRRLREWDDHGTRRAGEPEGTPLPAAVGKLSPFVLGALAEGIPLDTARLLAAICARAGDLPEGENEAHAALSGSLLNRPDEEPLVKAGPLLKAVLRPGSRGGHVYWADGKLRYGTPPLWSPKKDRGGTATIKPTWLPPGRLARRILAEGHRVLYAASDDSHKWGEVIAASGELLSVLPDDASQYDLLHTVVVPAERVLRVIPDREGLADDHEDDERDPGLGKSAAAGDGLLPGPGGAAPDLAPWPGGEEEDAD